MTEKDLTRFLKEYAEEFSDWAKSFAPNLVQKFMQENPDYVEWFTTRYYDSLEGKYDNDAL